MCNKDENENSEVFPEDVFPDDVFPKDIFPTDIFPRSEDPYTVNFPVYGQLESRVSRWGDGFL